MPSPTRYLTPAYPVIASTRNRIRLSRGRRSWSSLPHLAWSPPDSVHTVHTVHTVRSQSGQPPSDSQSGQPSTVHTGPHCTTREYSLSLSSISPVWTNKVERGGLGPFGDLPVWTTPYCPHCSTTSLDKTNIVNLSALPTSCSCPPPGHLGPRGNAPPRCRPP